MRALGMRKKSDFCSAFIGRDADVLVEEKIDKASGFLRGFSRNYLPVAVAGALSNREVRVRIDGLRDGWLTGSLSDAGVLAGPSPIGPD
jgi:hypothetical protein